MAGERDSRRLLIVAGPESSRTLSRLLESAKSNRREIAFGACFAEAQFILQHQIVDLVLVNEDVLGLEQDAALAWFIRHCKMPVILLAHESGELFDHAYRMGVTLCLPRSLVLRHPPLLLSALEQVAKVTDLQQLLVQTREQLFHGRRHVDRLVNIVWRLTPDHAEQQWFSQRHMLDRLQEELSRAERHKSPLTLVLGEMHAHESECEFEPASLPDWTPPLIVRAKRRCDVAGQYGAHGFLLLLVETSRDGGVACCRRLSSVLEHPPEALGCPHTRFRAQFGISSTAASPSTAVALLSAAEQDLEAARAQLALS